MDSGNMEGRRGPSFHRRKRPPGIGRPPELRVPIPEVSHNPRIPRRRRVNLFQTPDTLRDMPRQDLRNREIRPGASRVWIEFDAAPELLPRLRLIAAQTIADPEFCDQIHRYRIHLERLL